MFTFEFNLLVQHCDAFKSLKSLNILIKFKTYALLIIIYQLKLAMFERLLKRETLFFRRLYQPNVNLAKLPFKHTVKN